MELTTIIVPAPAKINLFLHVVGRRNDGYHRIESAMVYLRFGDTLTLTTNRTGAIAMDAAVPGVPDEANLCLRAARALRDATGVRAGVTIALEKRIPMGAGLGGGSSDAASVLLALNRLWNADLPRERLMQIGLQLGADVPFFVFGQAAIARGVGEILTAVSLPERDVIVAKPDVHASTPTVFAQTDLKRDTLPLQVDAMALSHGRNDLQPVTERLFPPIADVRAALGETARMTGSGASVFNIVPAGYANEPFTATVSRQTARQTAPQTGATPAWQIRTRLCARHPLCHYARDD